MLVVSTVLQRRLKFVAYFAESLRGSLFEARSGALLPSLFQTQLLVNTAFTHLLRSCCSLQQLNTYFLESSKYFCLADENQSVNVCSTRSKQISSNHSDTLAK